MADCRTRWMCRLRAAFNAADAIGVVALACIPYSTYGADGVTVDMTLVGVDAIELAYQLPASCTRLPLASPFDKVLVRHARSSWVHEGSCGALDDGTINRPPSCREVRFRVRSSDEIHDRIYPPAYPIDGLGVYVHTGLFAPTDACGPVTWRFAAPHGEVVFDGTRRGHRYVAEGGGAGHASFASVYLSARPLPVADGPVTVYAPGVPRWIRATLEDASHAVDARYRAIAGDIDVEVPAVVVSDREDGGPSQTKADVANQRMMRIGFKNFAETHDDESMRSFLRGLIAHEFAHVLQNPALGEDDISWEAEGGAEFLRWITLYRLGWKTAEQSAADLGDSINRCIETAGERPWRAIPERKYGRMPYTCGLAIHAIALASRQTTGSPEATLMLFYRAARNNAGASPAQWLECGSVLNCEPRVIPALLDGDGAFGPAVMKTAMRLGIAKRDMDPPDSETRLRSAGRVFAAIMAKDCNGSYSFNTSAAHIDVLPADGCRSLRGGQTVIGMAGTRFDDPVRDAGESTRVECTKSGSIALMLAKGDPLAIACPDSVPQPSPRIVIDAKALFAKLDRN